MSAKTNSMTAPALRAMLALAALVAGAACAQDPQALQDPTRPPAGPLSGDAPAAATVGPQLQSILIGRAPGGRRLAVIDGETVRQGESFHGARVARVSDTEVELVRGRERQVLRLYDQAAPAALASAPANIAAAPAAPEARP